MEFLGVWLNTHQVTMEIEQNRLQTIRVEIENWLGKKQATRKEVESLVSPLDP